MIEVYGFQDEVEPFFASGMTSDVSRLGVLAELDAPIHASSVCKVFFRGTGEQIRPHHVCGRVTRCEENHGRFRVAVEFDEPLLRLEIQEVPALVAGARPKA